jgi:hypothetical protein
MPKARVRNKWGHDVHKYVRVTFDNPKRGGEKTFIWKCTLTNCGHYLVGEMVLGKLTLCNRCGETVFEMKEIHLKSKKPHCLICTKRYKGKTTPDISVIAANLEALLKVE